MEKRITLLAGHYGSGKTSVAVQLAKELRKTHDKVVIADLDIVNPYFRTKDSAADLEELGILLISSEFANSNLDIPALPQELYRVTDDRSFTAVMDIGGDDRGALALGRYAPKILEEDDFEMLFVANCFRPLTRDAASALEVMKEIESASKMPFTGLVNNSNLGPKTTAEHVLSSLDFIKAISEKSALPIRFTSVAESLKAELEGKIKDLLFLKKK